MSMSSTDRKLLTLVLVVAMAWIVGCDDDQVGLEADRSSSSYLNEGWDLFSDGNNNSAIISFNLALDGDPQNPEPYIGLGWAWAKIGVLDAALENFVLARGLGSESPDVYAGTAIVRRDLIPVDYMAVVENAQAALDIDSAYAMSRHSAFNWQDLHVLLAQSYFAMMMYEDANTQVELLGGTPTPVTDGPSRAALVLEIQRLTEMYAE
jgi:tetratricopeptide (TPR) repeat protein